MNEDEKLSTQTASKGVRFPAYELADRRFRQKAFEAVRLAEPFLGQIDLVESDHSGPIRSVGGDKPFDAPFELHSATVSISVKDLEGMNFAGYAAMIAKGTHQFMEAFAKGVFQHFGAVSKHVGNVVDTKGKSLFEQFKEGIMKVELAFDDDGNLIPKQLVLDPSMKEEAQVAMDAVFRDREVQARILSERQKFLASRGQRRLLSPC